MMELVTGPFRPALEESFAETFARLRRGDPLAPIAVVAPSKRLSDRLKEIALRAVPEGFAGVRFLNLFSFARTLYDEAAPPGRRVALDPLVASRLVEAVLRRHFKDAPYLSRACSSPGAILGVLHELKAAAVKPEHALELLAFKDLGVEESPKLAEILSLYKRVTDELRRRKIDERADVVRIAAEHAPASAWLGSLRHVIYYGFYDLDQNQLDLLREVCRRAAVTVFFPYVENPGYEYARAFLREIVAPMAAEVRELPARARPPRTARIAASGAQDEAWAAAKEILRWTDAGIPYGEIAVVARTLQPYVGHVESIFREHLIPFASSARRRLDRDPRVKAARLLFSLGDFDRGDVMDLLRSPFFRRGGGDPELWDQASRLMGVGRGTEEWRRRLGAAVGRDYVYTEGGRGEQRRFVLPRDEVGFFWSSVKALLETAPPAGWQGFSDWALARYRRFLEPDGRVEEAIESLAGLEGFAAENPLGMLLNVLDGLSEPVGGRAGVQVLDAMAARGLSFRAIVVLGLNERIFPRYVLEDPFLRDAVRSRIEHKLGCRMVRKLQGYEEERMLFTLLMGAADEIVLSRQSSDEKGRAQIRSDFLEAGPEREISRQPEERLRSIPLELLTPREASLRTEQGEALGRALGWNVDGLVDALGFLRVVEAPGPLTKYDGLIDASSYWHGLAARGISPTALEKLAECPFRYFAAKVLDLEDLQEPEGEDLLSPAEVGGIYHRVLEGFHRNGDLERRADETFAELEERRTIRYPTLWEVEKNRILGVLRAFVKTEDMSVFKPVAFEQELRVELPLEVGGRRTVAFRGFADRVDSAPDGAFRVVDYKKSRSHFKNSMEKGIADGKYIQPPLYFLMAAQSAGKVAAARSKFVYSFLEGEGAKRELEGGSLEWRAGFEDLLRRLLETISRGEFAVKLSEVCSYCDFKTMCRKVHLPTVWRAEDARRC